MIAVIGAGAMGTAVAMVHARAGLDTTLLGTAFDQAVIEACNRGDPHPTLGLELLDNITCRPYQDWAEVLPRAERVVPVVSSGGLAAVAAEASGLVGKSVIWLTATKGWDPETLRTPAEVLEDAAGERGRVVALAGPALARELAAGAPAAIVCASRGTESARAVAETFAAAGISAEVTDDVMGVEVAAGYKNVAAIAVGVCQGLGERSSEDDDVRAFANAQSALFALGLLDMLKLSAPAGGRPETILGQAGGGDLYVTCLGGRNGTFGRLLGLGRSSEEALESVGSTVEGVANTVAALAVAAKLGVNPVVANAVDDILKGRAGAEEAITAVLKP